jgi:hypothetical protein
VRCLVGSEMCIRDRLLEDNQTFIPLIWKDLGVSGNSDQNLRLELVDTLLHWWTALKIPVPVFEICGDREFIGEYWLKELSRRNIQYVIRLRENLTFEKWSPDADARARKSETKEKSDLIALYKDLMIYEKQFVEIVLADEAIAHIFFVKNATKNCPNEAYIFFITNMDDIESAASFYRKRWKIELFFKHLKKAGFNLENFNMIGTHKTAILMSVLSIVYLIVYQLNQQQKEAKKILNQRNPIEWITYSNGKTYPRKSDFRIGKGLLASIKTLQSLLDICEHISEFILDKLVFLRNLHIRKLYAQ